MNDIIYIIIIDMTIIIVVVIITITSSSSQHEHRIVIDFTMNDIITVSYPCPRQMLNL